MSIITDQIKQYRGGSIDFDQLKSKLVDRTYPTPERMQGGPEDPIEHAFWLDEQPYYTDGTWDEVLRARNYGLLTSDEYDQINEAFDAGSKGAKKRGDKKGHPFRGNRYTKVARQAT